MTDTAYCYHCGTHHLKKDMKQVSTKAGKRWRCFKSIEATKRSRAERDAFGRRVSADNKVDAQSKARQILNNNR